MTTTASRDTTTGPKIEHYYQEKLENNGWSTDEQVLVDGITKDFCKADLAVSLIDISEAPRNDIQVLEFKNQSTSGTAEEKLDKAVAKLSLAVESGGYNSGTIILAGYGWSDVGLHYYLNEFSTPDKIRIISMHQFEKEYLCPQHH
jgi:hypothetical protein